MIFHLEIKNVSNVMLYVQEDVGSDPGIQSSLMTTTPVNVDSLVKNCQIEVAHKKNIQKRLARVEHFHFLMTLSNQFLNKILAYLFRSLLVSKWLHLW